MRKFAWVVVIISVLIVGFMYVEVGHATTPVSGLITQNTTWTTSGSPYYITGMVTVNTGVTLTIQPGVTVDLGTSQLLVNGILKAQGTSENKIVFLSASLPQIEYSSSEILFSTSCGSWSQGCMIDNAFVYSVPIVIMGGSPQISNCYFSNTSLQASYYSGLITVNGGSPLIENNVLNVPSTGSLNGIQDNYGSPTISSNLIVGGNYGIYVGNYVNGYASILNNNITNCWTGISAVGQAIIQNNNLMNNKNDGVDSTNLYSTIQENVIADNTQAGISGGSQNSLTGNISNNTIVNNNYGIYAPTQSASISYNNMVGNSQNVHLTNSSNINLSFNWWGSTNTQIINETIWDYKNDPLHLGTVQFLPCLNQSNSFAPSIPLAITIQSPPPTPSPIAIPPQTPYPTVTPYGTSIDFTPNPTLSPTGSPSASRITPSASPGQTPIEPMQVTPGPGFGPGSDIDNIMVIAASFILAVGIIAALNIKFGRQYEKRENKNAETQKQL